MNSMFPNERSLAKWLIKAIKACALHSIKDTLSGNAIPKKPYEDILVKYFGSYVPMIIARPDIVMIIEDYRKLIDEWSLVAIELKYFKKIDKKRWREAYREIGQALRYYVYGFDSAILWHVFDREIDNAAVRAYSNVVREVIEKLELPIAYFSTKIIDEGKFLVFKPLKSRAKKAKRKESFINSPYIAVIWGLWLSPFLLTAYLLIASANVSIKVQGSIYLYTFLFIAIGVGIAYLANLMAKHARSLQAIWQALAALLILAYLGVHVAKFISWMNTREYTLITADRDIGAILADDAVVSGSYGTALTQENGLRSIHHQFGITPDPDLFRKFPITHLVIDPGNEKTARKDYPEMMSGAELVTSYIIRGFPVKLYRISEASPSPDVKSYLPTDFELAMYWKNKNQPDSTSFYLDRFMSSGKKSYSAEMYLAEKAVNSKQYKTAIEHFQDACDLSSCNTNAAYGLGVTYVNASTNLNNPAYLDSALVYLELVQDRIPGNRDLNNTIDRLRRMRR